MQNNSLIEQPGKLANRLFVNWCEQLSVERQIEVYELTRNYEVKCDSGKHLATQALIKVFSNEVDEVILKVGTGPSEDSKEQPEVPDSGE